MKRPTPKVEGTEQQTPVSRGVRRFRAAWTAFIVVATSLPYLINWRATPAEFHYNWILPPYPEDSLAYQAWAQQAAHGSLLFHDKYTAMPHAAFLFHPFFLITGWISALSDGDIGVVFLLLKTAGVVWFLRSLYRYLDFLELDNVQSVAASVLAGVSSGFGGLVMWFGPWPISPTPPADLWLPDLNTFWSLLWNPLFPYSLTLLLLAVHCLDRGTRDGRRADFWRAGVATGVLALIHPYSQPLLLAYAVILTAVRGGRAAPGLLGRYALAALPLGLYVVLVAVFNPLVSMHSAQGEMNSPAVASYAYAFGLPLLLAGTGVAWWREREIRRWWPVLSWFLLAVALAYLPLWFQRKLVFGAHVPLGVMAGVAFGTIVGRFPGRLVRRSVLALTAVIGLPFAASTSVYLLSSEQREVARNADGAYYISDDVMAGLRFLKHWSEPEDIVWATLPTSRLIPAISGNTVLWGHWAMTVDAPERNQWAEHLFGENADVNDAGRAGEFWETGIRYIFADGELKKNIEQDAPAWRTILAEADPVYTNSAVIIYERRAGASLSR